MNRMTNNLINIFVFLAVAMQPSFAFVPRARVLTRDAFYSTKANVLQEKTSMTTLNLIGQVTKTSQPAPTPVGKTLLDFFSLPDSATLILRGSKNNQIVEITNPDASLVKAYEERCTEVNAQSPSSDDKFFDVTTSGVDFPGLKVMTVATIGVNIYLCKKGLPNYQFVLIKDSTYAVGNRIFVWFFNKVTGKDKNKENEGATTQSLNTIRTVPVGDDIAFEADAYLRVKVKFPSFLMKVIPNGKEKTEETGGVSLRKVLEADLPYALDKFRQEYVHWLESS